METIPTPEGKLLLTFAEFCARIPPEETAAWHARLEKAEEDLPSLMTRLDALNEAIGEGWCPSRIVKNELSRLDNVLNAYHLRKYPTETRQTLVDAELELATWQTLSPTERDAVWEADERAEAEIAARRKAEAVLRARHAEFYAAMQQMNVSPPRWLDNQIANWSLA